MSFGAPETDDFFFCEECHEIYHFDTLFCPDCHVGKCEGCGIPVTLENVGDRDFLEPALIWCKACYRHDNGIPDGCATPAVIRLTEAIRRAHETKLTHVEKAALSLLR